jgi:hypothetical protein
MEAWSTIYENGVTEPSKKRSATDGAPNTRRRPIRASGLRHSPPVVASLLLGGARAPPWSGRTDGASADAAADLDECRQLAADEAWRMSWEGRWPPYFYDPRFMPPYYAWMRPFWFDFPMSLEREQALFDAHSLFLLGDLAAPAGREGCARQRAAHVARA